jgi:RNA polymerase sigma factor (sigma-70 family)
LNNKALQDLYTKKQAELVSYARGIIGDDAEDVVQEAFLEVANLPDVPEGEKAEGVLFTYLKWRVGSHLRKMQHDRQTLEAELGMIEEDGTERPMVLGDLEERQSEHGRTPPWPTAVNYDSPEDIVTAAELRDRIRHHALASCSDTEYAVFLAITVDDKPQWAVAKEFNMDQATISRTVSRVRDAISAGLTEDGFDGLNV